MARAFHRLASERGPLLRDGIAGVPAAEDCLEIQLTQRVRPGNVLVVVNYRDIGRQSHREQSVAPHKRSRSPRHPTYGDKIANAFESAYEVALVPARSLVTRGV